MVSTRYYNLSKKCGLTSRSEVWLKLVRWLGASASLLCLSTVKVMTAHLKMLSGGRCYVQPRLVSLDPVCRLQPMPFGWM